MVGSPFRTTIRTVTYTSIRTVTYTSRTSNSVKTPAMGQTVTAPT